MSLEHSLSNMRVQVTFHAVFSGQVLLAWNKDTIVVAFRGTASLKNVLHDLQASIQIHKMYRTSLHAWRIAHYLSTLSWEQKLTAPAHANDLPPVQRL